MPQTPREVVKNAVTFNRPDRVPRDMWVLPWAENRYPEACAALRARFPGDIANIGGLGVEAYAPSPRVRGERYAAGRYVDEWGCVFENIQPGVIGEVKDPLVKQIEDWRDVVKPPVECLPEDPASARDAVNRACAQTDLFVKAGCLPRPWERYQFLRGTEEAMVDMMEPEEGGAEMLRAIHEFHLRELEFWVATDVDAVFFMDDWGAQRQLLIPPPVWRELFKPLYRDYCQLAHAHGKLAMMHSDGCILDIYPDLIEVGVDALNSQLFCMGLDKLAAFKGKICFWGEIDRQHILPSEDPEEGRRAVREVAAHLATPEGGVIAQFEFGPGADPETVRAVHEAWAGVSEERFEKT